MKKVLMGVLLLGLIAAVSATPAWAQGKKVDFSLNLGVQTNIWSGTSFDNAWFTLDARVGIPLGKMWEISPELMYAVDDSFDFGFGWLYPGVLINFKSGGFFVGAGATLPFFFGEGESESGNIAPKINLGYNFGALKLTAYLIVFTETGLDFFDMNQAGVTLGYRF